MSHLPTVKEELDRLALATPCLLCKAEAYCPCVTPQGRVLHYLHARRTEPIRSAYWLGYTEHQVEQDESMNKVLHEFASGK